jgi:ATP phosphoribosyltransferase
MLRSEANLIVSRTAQWTEQRRETLNALLGQLQG